MRDSYLKPEDYAEPRCLLCNEAFGISPEIISVPQDRIIEKMNEYMGKNDYDGAEKHLLYWLNEAILGNDKRGELMIRNELVGHYRKTGNKEGAYSNADVAVSLLKELGFEGDKSAGITYINIATAYNAFGDNEKSIEVFKKAQDAFAEIKDPDNALLGGLYNNMALTLSSLNRYDEALSYFDMAINYMQKVKNGELEQAITYLNIADVYNASKGFESSESKIYELLDKAYDLLNTDSLPKDGYYAFVCEKCAPSFSFYGYFAAANEFKQKAKEIYERN